MASVIPKELKKEITDAWRDEAQWKVALFNSSYTPTTASVYSTTNEITGAGYTAGGVVLSGRASSYVDTTNSMLDATDSQWSTATFTANYAVVYNTASPYKIRFIYDLGGAVSVTNGTFTIVWATGGLVKIS